MRPDPFNVINFAKVNSLSWLESSSEDKVVGGWLLILSISHRRQSLSFFRQTSRLAQLVACLVQLVHSSELLHVLINHQKRGELFQQSGLMFHQKTEPLYNKPRDMVEALGYQGHCDRVEAILGYLGARPKPNLLSGLQTKLGDKYPQCASYLIVWTAE